MRTPENTYDIFTALKDEIDKNRIQRSELTEADDASVFLLCGGTTTRYAPRQRSYRNIPERRSPAGAVVRSRK